MNIVSWNVNGLRACVRKGCFDWLLNYNPDIFCLQETKAHPEQLPTEVRKPSGYFSYFDHSKTKKGYSGVAVFSKEEPTEVYYGLGVNDLDQEGRYLELHFSNIVLINTYFPNGGGGPERLAFKLRYYDEFLKKLESLDKEGKKVVFCGDVNTAHKEIDLARPKENVKNTGFLPEERAWIDKLIERGYIDTFRYLFPDKKEVYTYWDMKTFARDRNVGWRIDYFFVSNSLKDSIKSFSVFDKVLGSDHCPIGLKLDL